MFKQRLLFKICMVAGLITIAVPAATAADPAANMARADEMNKIIEGMKGFADNFNKRPVWKVDFTQTRKFEHLPPGFSDKWPTGSYSTAKKGKLMYLYRRLDDKPPLETWTAWRDGVSTHRFKNGDYHIIPDFHVDFLQQMFYTQGLFIDIYQDHAITTPSLANMLKADSFSEAFWLRLPAGIERRKNEWSLKTSVEKVDGVDCSVLVRVANGFETDRLWVDIAHGFLCRRRQYFQAPGQLLNEWINSEIREVETGLFLPFRQILKSYNSKTSPPEFVGKLHTMYTNEVQSISFQAIPDEFFVAPMIKEGQVMDLVSGQSYVLQPEGSDPAQRVSRALADDGHRRIGVVAGSGSRYLLLAVNFALLMVGLLVMQLRQIQTEGETAQTVPVDEGTQVSSHDTP